MVLARLAGVGSALKRVTSAWVNLATLRPFYLRAAGKFPDTSPYRSTRRRCGGAVVGEPPN